jgi:hypothetical protein
MSNQNTLPGMSIPKGLRHKPKDLPDFKWINTVLGNLSTTPAGAFHAPNYRTCGQAYLPALAHQFSRRFDLRGLLTTSLIVDVVRCKRVPERVVRLGMLRQVSCRVPGYPHGMICVHLAGPKPGLDGSVCPGHARKRRVGQAAERLLPVRDDGRGDLPVVDLHVSLWPALVGLCLS